jgi:CBS domain-containing protein
VRQNLSSSSQVLAAHIAVPANASASASVPVCMARGHEKRRAEMRAHQIMTRKVITVATAASIVDAANTMLAKHVSGLPVIDETGRLVGIVSQGDFIRRAEIGTQRKRGRWLKFLLGPGRVASDFVHERGRKVGEIMTLDPCTVTEDSTLEDIVQLMEHNNVKRLPVMRGDRLVGIVTRSNLLQAVAELAREVPDPTADDDHIRSHRESRLDAFRSRRHRA